MRSTNNTHNKHNSTQQVRETERQDLKKMSETLHRMKEKLTGESSTTERQRNFDNDDDMDYNDQGAGWHTVSEHTTTTTSTGLPGMSTTTTGLPITSSATTLPHQQQQHESMWDRTKDKAHEMKLDAQEKMDHLKSKVTGRDDYTTRRDNW